MISALMLAVALTAAPVEAPKAAPVVAAPATVVAPAKAAPAKKAKKAKAPAKECMTDGKKVVCPAPKAAPAVK